MGTVSVPVTTRNKSVPVVAAGQSGLRVLLDVRPFLGGRDQGSRQPGVARIWHIEERYVLSLVSAQRRIRNVEVMQWFLVW